LTYAFDFRAQFFIIPIYAFHSIFTKCCLGFPNAYFVYHVTAVLRDNWPAAML